eukprot:GHVN01064342.1.p1 GENE.GHVN01064342.1~~GHVN01064342.1.p1  ORF type:complete len:100 (-),score=3.47 GHVN01064342.1:1439-1738(-)
MRTALSVACFTSCMALTLAETNHPSANALGLVGGTLEQFDREEAKHRQADFLTNGNGAYMDIQSLLRTLTLAMRVDKSEKSRAISQMIASQHQSCMLCE